MIGLVYIDTKLYEHSFENYSMSAYPKFRYFGYTADTCENIFYRFKPKLKAKLRGFQLRLIEPIRKVRDDGSILLLPPGPAAISMDANQQL